MPFLPSFNYHRKYLQRFFHRPESFYRTIKRELIQDAKYESPEQAQKDIFKYIEMYYNTKRIHSALGYISPAQFEELNS